MSQARAKLMHARTLLSQGKVEQARAALTRALASHPGDPDLNGDMARVLSLSGQFEQAVFFAQRADRARPNDPATLSLLGGMLMGALKPAQAEPVLARAVALAPALLDAAIGRVNVLLALDRPREAADAAGAALAHHPGDALLSLGLAHALLGVGRPEESGAVLRDAVREHPGDASLAAALATSLNYSPDATPAESLAAHEAHGALVRQSLAETGGPSRPPGRPEGPDRRLRVAFLSPDLRHHSVAFFLEPLLERLDPAQMDVVLYSTSVEEDRVTERLRRLGAWRPCADLSDSDLSARVRADGVDVLVDLAGLTNGGRPGVLAAKPAPLQVTYLGYPATTGLREVDLRLVDSVTDPSVEEAAPYTTERLVRLDPCFLCFKPPEDAPPVRPRPDAGPVTFGSFNAIQKLNARVIGTWGRVLGAVAGSRLILKAAALADPGTRADLSSRLVRAGVAPERIELLGWTADPNSHLDLYGRVDIALDPFPYNGTTTTCDALLMGVPVVTLAGPPGQHQGRVGASLLRAVGHPELVASSEEEYVARAGALAMDARRRTALREALRPRLLGSPLCDAAGLAERFTAALRQAWRELCRAAHENGPPREGAAR